ncbi:MAG: hypothetical protein ACLGJB_03640 [Blastocatellia bacterium]
MEPQQINSLDPFNYGHTIERRSRERIVEHLMQAYRKLNSWAKASQIIEDAKKENPRGLPF